MLGGQSASLGRHHLIFGCVADPLRRRRLESALKHTADLQWFADFSEIGEALKQETRRVHVVVFDITDCRGASGAGLARTLSETNRGIGLVAYRAPGEITDAQLCILGASGVHDTLLHGVTDEGFTARAIVLDASRRGAAERVLAELQSAIPPRLMIVAESVVRDPANSTVAKVSGHLHIHRQTINAWCRKDRFLRSEELLIWCRLLFVAALLELINRTLDSISTELEYGSATALRNQLKRYTGLTATAIRSRGLSLVAELFRGRIAQHRAGFSGQPAPESNAKPERVAQLVGAERR